jgi:hypothetical protein
MDEYVSVISRTQLESGGSESDNFWSLEIFKAETPPHKQTPVFNRTYRTHTNATKAARRELVKLNRGAK